MTLRLSIGLIIVVCVIMGGMVIGTARHEEPGKRLAAQYCQSCHLQPLPEHLDKATWVAKVFPVMRKYMGMDTLEQRGQLTHDLAAMYPTVPMMTEDEWFAVASWYIDNAPSTLPAAVPPTELGQSPVFTSILIPGVSAPPMTSVVQFDTMNKQIIVGDAQSQQLRIVDLAGLERASVDVQGPPSCLVIKGNTWYVTNMGKLLPHDSAVGSVVQIRWNGRPGARGSTFQRTVLIDSLRRPTNLVVHDLNQDGRDDLLVTEYGNLLGRFGWFELLPSGRYSYHELSPQPGAIRAIVTDINKDRRPDIVVVMAQAREVVRAYINQGKGRFTSTDLIESPPSYGSSSLSLADIDRDGTDEILLTTGDNGDYDAPPFKPYHGLYVYKRVKPLRYERMTFARFDGAYGALAHDYDRNGRTDVLTFSYFPRLTGAPSDVIRYVADGMTSVSGIWSIAHSDKGRWLVSDAADADGDGDIDVILGNVSIGPGLVTDQQAEVWMSSGVQALFLRNNTR